MLVALAVGMLGFAFALVPLYDAFCELTGLNGRTAGKAVQTEPDVVDESRTVTVQLLAKVGKGLPCEFRPLEPQLQVRPGEIRTTYFLVRNRSGKAVTGQAVPSVSPGIAAASFQKVECFCFTQQRLEPGEEMNLPVRFFIDSELPEEVHTISLSYTLFRVNDAQTGVSGG